MLYLYPNDLFAKIFNFIKFIKFLKSKQVLVKIKYQHIINILFPKDLYEVHQKIDIYINIYF